MVQPIGSRTPPLLSAPATSGLRAQLATAERELADCLNCDSARTRSGQDRIQAATRKVQALQARIEEAQDRVHASREDARPLEGTPVEDPLGTILDFRT